MYSTLQLIQSFFFPSLFQEIMGKDGVDRQLSLTITRKDRDGEFSVFAMLLGSGEKEPSRSTL